MIENTIIPEGKKLYFVSDAHLGYPNFEGSLVREKKLVALLEKARQDAAEVFMLGDIFEFWFEWKWAVPKGFSRLLAKMAELTENGIPVHFFTGNHDIWVFDYLSRETGAIVHRQPITRIFNEKKFYLAHGDGLGPFDRNFKILKKLFTNKFLQWLFARVHPNAGIGFAHYWSGKSRYANRDSKYNGPDKEWLVVHARNVLKEEHFDYFVFGHRHLKLDIQLTEKSRYINLGDWINYFSYAMFDGKELYPLFFEQKNEI